MEEASTKGILSHLSCLETQARGRGRQSEEQARVNELKAKIKELKARKEELKAEINVHKNLQHLRSPTERLGSDEAEKMDEDSQLLQLMARHTELQDLFHAHQLLGGYEATRQGKRLCVSLTTAYEGVYLDTYKLEMDLKPKVRIGHNNIPPFIPLSNLAEQINIQTNMKVFLSTLSWHLNAFAGRKQQLQLIKDQHKSIKVMESNILCSVLILMLTEKKTSTALLCTLHYKDHTSCLPTQVHFDCEDQKLLASPEWKKTKTLLTNTPVHKALTMMKKKGMIV